MGTYRTFYRLPATGNYTMLVGAGTLGPFPHLNYRISLNRILPRTNDRIAYGDTITTILTDPSGELWTFDGGNGDIISVVMWSRDAPPILELRGVTGQLLREGMAIEPQYWDRETLIHILPSETTYHTYMLYTTLDLPPESPAGEYILSLHALDPERIEIGQMVSRELTDPTGDFTTFYGVTGDEVCVRWNERIHARAANFVLYAPDYSVYDLVTPMVQSNECYRLPTTGWYLTALYAIDPMPLVQPEPYSFSLYYESVP
jgi:hypothetical protein